jgi:hypothetical protein
MKPEAFSTGEQHRRVPIGSNEAQIPAMWLCAEEKLGRKLDRSNPTDKQAMLGIWFAKNLPGDKNLAEIWGEYARSHPDEIDIDDEGEVLEAIHQAEETIH